MKKKLLFTNDIAFGGGVEKLMYDMVMAWHEKYDITVFTMDYDEQFYDQYPRDVQYLSLPRRLKTAKDEHGALAVSRKIHRALLQCRINLSGYDILLCMKDGWQMWRGVRYKIPVKLAWNHTDYNNAYYSHYIFGSKENEVGVMQQYKNIVCVSKDIKKGICDVIGDPGNLVVRYNPINVEYILKKANEPVTDIDIMRCDGDKMPVRFVSVGRINVQKGYTLLIEACKFLEDEGYDFEVLIFGAREDWGEEYDRIQHAIKNTGVRNCKFLGGRANPYKYIAIADWFISSSIFEGYSLVSQEAAVLDVPMLLTDCSGVRELLGDSEYGIVMPINVNGIYKAMKKVLDDPSLHEYYKQKISERKSIINYETRLFEIETLFSN